MEEKAYKKNQASIGPEKKSKRKGNLVNSTENKKNRGGGGGAIFVRQRVEDRGGGARNTRGEIGLSKLPDNGQKKKETATAIHENLPGKRKTGVHSMEVKTPITAANLGVEGKGKIGNHPAKT